MQYITIKTRLIFQSDADRLAIIHMLDKVRDVWNFISEQHFRVDKNGYLDCENIVDLHAKVYYTVREKFDNIKGALVVQTENSVISAYKKLKSTNPKLKKPPRKKKLSLATNCTCFSICGTVISLISLKKQGRDKRIKCVFQSFKRLEEHLAKYKHGDPEIFVRDGEVWIAFPFKIQTPESISGSTCGIDLGIRRFAATSEGKLFISKEHNRKQRKTRYLKSSLKSKGTKSAHRHLNKIRHKEHDRNKNFHHHLANSIIASTQADTLVLEDLNVHKMKTKSKFNKTTGKSEKTYGSKNRISQMCFGMLRFFLTYKCKLTGKSILFVNPAYTSQTDHVTGLIEGERRGRRFYAKSGLVYDSDVNAAVNIARRSKLPVSYRNVLDGQGIVICPIVCKSSSLVLQTSSC